MNLDRLGVHKNLSMILSTKQWISAIKKLGGIPIIAHPGEFEKQFQGDSHVKRDTLYLALCELIRMGLVGLEVFHPKHTAQQELEYLILAKRLGLLITAGSDFHGRHTMSRKVGMHGVRAIDIMDVIMQK